jgi:hypothetical protein
LLQRKPVTELKGTTVITHHFEGTALVRASQLASGLHLLCMLAGLPADVSAATQLVCMA